MTGSGAAKERGTLRKRPNSHWGEGSARGRYKVDSITRRESLASSCAFRLMGISASLSLETATSPRWK